MTIDRYEHRLINIDPQHRPVRLFTFDCPACGSRTSLYGTTGPNFSLDIGGDAFNIWHLEINEAAMTVTISPSIGLDKSVKTGQPCSGHTANCHLTLTNEPFIWEE